MIIRLAGHDEAMSIVREPDTINRIGKIPDQMTCQPWVFEDCGYRLLAVFWIVSLGCYEAHIAMPKREIRASRWLAYQLLAWLFSHGANRVQTNCPEGKIANLARKLGMFETGKMNGTIYFEVTPWVLEPQWPVAQ